MTTSMQDLNAMSERERSSFMFETMTERPTVAPLDTAADLAASAQAAAVNAVVKTEVEAAAEAAEDAEAAELLAKAKLDHIPTVEEAKAILAARRAEIRHAVMVEADRRDWCEDGTRKVCANLRLERPGSRTERVVEVELTMKLTVPVATYTEEGVLRKLSSKGILSSTWMRNQLYVRDAEVTPLSAVLDGKALDVSTLTEKKPEVAA